MEQPAVNEAFKEKTELEEWKKNRVKIAQYVLNSKR